MLQKRTDLALEAREIWQEAAGEEEYPEGVEIEERVWEGCGITEVRITNEQGARQLGKAKGTYVTLELSGLKRREDDAFGRAVRALGRELSDMLAGASGAALVVGLGNSAITPDDIGPGTARHTLATRHLVQKVPEHFGHFRPVAVLSPGVLAATGVESSELVRSVVERIEPACVIAVDALASRSLKRVCTTIQLTDTGITPGSGVGNHRAVLDRDALGVPVIAVGVPTVVDVATLCADVLEETGQGELEPDTLRGADMGLMVTPRDIDQSVADLSKVIGYGINLALHPGLTIADMELFLS